MHFILNDWTGPFQQRNIECIHRSVNFVCSRAFWEFIALIYKEKCKSWGEQLLFSYSPGRKTNLQKCISRGREGLKWKDGRRGEAKFFYFCSWKIPLNNFIILKNRSLAILLQTVGCFCPLQENDCRRTKNNHENAVENQKSEGSNSFG